MKKKKKKGLTKVGGVGSEGVNWVLKHFQIINQVKDQ